MHLDQRSFDSATALALAIRNKEISSRDLLEHYLQRIERYNQPINAVVTLDVERARARADLADAASARGESWGPLHGVPMTIKDSFQTEGLRTTSGAPTLKDYVPTSNAVAVQRLIDAGAIVFGKTNLSMFGGDVQSYNPIFGTSNNPWNLTRTTGGSSGGAAAAVATGMTTLELGSDLAGSIRVPAHYCGVYGHKPSHGLVSLRGHIPGPPGYLSEPDIVVAGPLARHAEDLSLALDILIAPNAEQATAWRVALPPPRHTTLKDFRVAAWIDEDDCPLDHGMRQRYQTVVEALREAGVAVDESARPALSFMQAHKLFVSLLLALKSPGVPPDEFQKMARQADQLTPEAQSIDDVSVRASTIPHREWIMLNEARLRMCAAWAEFFQHYDVLLCPVTPNSAHPHDHSEPLVHRTLQVNGESRSYLAIMAWSGVIGVTHLPATVAPVGVGADGLPIGIQIVGPYLEDHTPIAFAGLLAKVIGGFQAPAGY